MRFTNYLVEEKDRFTINKEAYNIAEHLVSDCKPFLDEANGVNFYRGSRHGNFLPLGGMGRYTTRTDRNPKDMPVWLHQMFDVAFEKKFGWKARSEGLFASTGKAGASIFGSVSMVFPIGEIEYVWAPKVVDLFDALSVWVWFSHITSQDVKDLNREDAMCWFHGVQDMLKFKIIGVPADWKTSKEIMEHAVDSIVTLYKDTDLSKARAKNTPHEVAFRCREYYLVGLEYEEDLQKALQ